MKKKHILKRLVFIATLFAISVISYSQTKSRVNENFDFDWKFVLGDSAKASSVTFDDSRWENVQLPHDWSIKLQPRQANKGSMGFYPGGIGWYRKSFIIPNEAKGKNVIIQFDGVYHQCDVYINGKHLGFHPYGYTGFEYDLTHYLKFGANNIISVRVDHSDSPSSRWYSGSGIYRHVRLKINNPVHVATWGTSITTPEITENGAKVNIATTIKNSSASSQKIRVQNRIIDFKGNVIVSAESSVSAGGKKETIVEQSMHVQKPFLWSTDSPYLYALETNVFLGNELTDQCITSFGIRSIKFDANNGFFLNGKNMKLKGFCLHQDAGSLGTAVPDKSYYRRLKIIKEFGCNAVRCSHNPPSPEFLDICDSLGIVVIDEAFDKWRSGYYTKYFDTWWKKDINAMVLRDRNHPSVILWSIGNETKEQDDTSSEGAVTAKMLHDYIHEIDPSRLVTAAIRPTKERKYNQNGFAEALDIVGYNYQEPWLIEDKALFPTRKMFISEAYPYYRGGNGNYKDYNPQNPWFDVAKNDFVFGQFIWAGIDYLGESSGWPSTGWPTCLFDECLFEKPRAAFHRSVWKDEPMVRIAVADQSLDIDPGKDHWVWPNLAEHWNFPQYNDHIIDVWTTTNCETVELYLNGNMIGTRKTADFTNNTIVWHVPYHSGKIEAKGYIGKKEVANFHLESSGRPAQIKLSADCENLSADGQDLSHISIQLVDDRGVAVPDDDREIILELSGNGGILGLDNGDLRTTEALNLSKIKTYWGKALATVQAGRSQGEIKLTVKSENLPQASVSIKCK